MNRDEILADVESESLLIGAVKWRSRWRYFAGTLGEWTLDYPAYDPSYQPAPGDRSFRGGLLRVDQTNADQFCEVMRPYELRPEEIRSWVKERGAVNVPLMMVVDFDERKFVDGYHEAFVPKSEYVPAGWQGIDGDPYDHVPPEVSDLWRALPEPTTEPAGPARNTSKPGWLARFFGRK